MNQLSGQIINLIDFYISKGANVVTLDIIESGDDLRLCIGNDSGPIALEDLPEHFEKTNGVRVEYKSDEELGNSLLLIIEPQFRSQIKIEELIDVYVAMMKQCGECSLNIHRIKDSMKYSVSCKELNALYSELDANQLDEQLKKHFTALEERLI